MTQQSPHLLIAVAFAVVALAFRVATANRLIHRRLVLSALLFFASAAIGSVSPRLSLPAESAALLASIQQLALVAGLIHFLVTILLNPWRVSRVSERFPAIVQDTIVVCLFVAYGVVVMHERFLTISAIGGVIVGFALQDTLGNLFAGLAIQLEKPFRVGHWITVGEFEGRVAEITWRATRLQTKTGNFVVVPNNVVSREAIVNYSEPALPTRLQVEVGVSYSVPPNAVKAAIAGVLAEVPGILREPAPEVLLAGFGDSSIRYLVRFWVDDYSRDQQARDRVLSAIYYILKRKEYEIPFPIQVEIQREDRQGRPPERTAALNAAAARVDILAVLSEAERRSLVAESGERIYAAGETIVREGEPGDSMFVICDGRVRVTVGPARQEVAVIEKGGYFGEMSLLTGDPRTADVTAIVDCTLIEITAETFRRYLLANPACVEQIAAMVEERRAGLARARAAAPPVEAVPAPPRSLLARIQSFLRLT